MPKVIYFRHCSFNNESDAYGGKVSTYFKLRKRAHIYCRRQFTVDDSVLNAEFYSEFLTEFARRNKFSKYIAVRADKYLAVTDSLSR